MKKIILYAIVGITILLTTLAQNVYSKSTTVYCDQYYITNSGQRLPFESAMWEPRDKRVTCHYNVYWRPKNSYMPDYDYPKKHNWGNKKSKLSVLGARCNPPSEIQGDKRRKRCPIIKTEYY